MAHVELSLSESFPTQGGAVGVTAVPRGIATPELAGGIDRWAATVGAASEPCLVLDAQARIVAASRGFCTLLGLGDPDAARGRLLVDGVLRLIDFTAARTELTEAELDKIPPLLALSSGRLARGLMRVYGGADSGVDATVDAIATPLWEAGTVVGSLTFLSAI